MEQILLKANIRKNTGKGYARRLRQKGSIPAVLCGRKEESLSLEIDKKSLKKVLSTEAGDNVIINLKIDGTDKAISKTAILKEKQLHFTSHDIIHADFQHISLDEKIEVNIPIHLEGKAKGVKEGGILEHTLWEITVRSLPSQISENINIDISNLGINETFYVKDITLEEGIEILSDPEQSVVTIRPVIEEAEGEEAAIKGEPQAPEVITARRKEEVESKED
ncbi:MAG: 50S ribosomal protein L25 [bacterium]|nr:50S ribosomal protein L25 [bacterium]